MAEAAKAQKNNPAPEKAAPPAGLDDVGLPRVDGWYNAEKNQGEWIQIKLMGSFIIHDTKRNTDRTVIVCKLGPNMTCKAASTEDKDSFVELKAGQILGLGVSFDLQILTEYVEGSVFWIRPTKKRSIGSGRTMWDFDKKRERGDKKSAEELAREKSRQPVRAGASADEMNDDDIPF